MPIAMVERETNLGKDTLRVWERRYGFPTPERSPAGDRLYSPAQVQQLKLISRLLGLGLRPGKIVGLDEAALQALLLGNSPQPSDAVSNTNEATNEAANPSDTTIEALLHTISTHDPVTLRYSLSQAQLRMGLASFVMNLVAPLTTAVGEAWAQGRFEVFEEHLYTEVLTGVLRHGIASLATQPAPRGPKVLLTTIPQEQHSLGLLMVEAILVLEGCTCVSLGTQTPLADISKATQAHRADVVGLSFSNLLKPALVQASLRELRGQLSPSTTLWVGGACSALHQKSLAGVRVVQHLSELAPLVALWRRGDSIHRKKGLNDDA